MTELKALQDQVKRLAEDKRRLKEFVNSVQLDDVFCMANPQSNMEYQHLTFKWAWHKLRELKAAKPQKGE